MKLSQFDQYDQRTKELVCNIMGQAQVLFAIVTETGCDNFNCNDDEIQVVIRKGKNICGNCDGDGKIWDNGYRKWEICLQCKGEGRHGTHID